MTDDIKLAFQDGLRTAINVVQTAKLDAYEDDMLRGYRELDNVAKALRMLLDSDLSVPAISYEARLECVADTIEAIVDHAHNGGSFRMLIYDRLGFDVDAYVPLFHAGGMTISNEFVITEADPGDQELASRLLSALWPKNGSNTVDLIGGQEPWITVCESSARIRDLSAALQIEQEKRRRIESELDHRIENVGPDGYHAPATK